jgi:hypothetical protein
MAACKGYGFGSLLVAGSTALNLCQLLVTGAVQQRIMCADFRGSCARGASSGHQGMSHASMEDMATC